MRAEVGGRHVHNPFNRGLSSCEITFPLLWPSILPAHSCRHSCYLKLSVFPGPQTELEAEKEAKDPRLKRL